MDQEEAEHHMLLRKCRLCAKAFPRGRSLGGHMRCHLSSSSTSSSSFSSSSSMEDNHDSTTDHKAPATGYGLRENPKKTWRLSPATRHDGDAGKQRRCRDCGKLFRSWPALFGHMRCHSRRNVPEVDSWSVPKRKRMPRPIAGSSPPEYEEEEEQVDVAIGLMMLSRDVGYWSTGFAESSDKNSAVLAELEKPRDCASDEEEAPAPGTTFYSSVVSVISTAKKKSRYECATCNKSFHSYQALGGHRAAHKRGRGCRGDRSLEADASIGDRKAKGDHQCGICGKVFASGQALGGHKRTHLVRSSATVAAAIEEEEDVEAVAMPDLLDLNFPAPVDEDYSCNGRGDSAAAAAASADAEFESWWAGSSLKSEAIVGMIA